MARNSSGTYSLYTPGNPVVTSTPISSTWANNTLTDIATALTDSLSRSGDGGMSVPLELTNGSAAAPSLTFASNPTVGLYRIGEDQLGISTGGTLRLSINADGNVTVAAPAAGVAAAINGFAGSTTLTLQDAAVPKLALLVGATERAYISYTESTSTTRVDSDGPVTIAPNNTLAMTLSAAGNVTIAAPSSGVPLALPTGGLTVSDGTTTLSGLVSSSTGILGTTSNHALEIRTNNTARLTFAASGAFTFNGSGYIDAAGTEEAIRLNSTGETYLSFYMSGTRSGYMQTEASWLSIVTEGGRGFYFSTAGRQSLTIAAAGNITLGAPSSGVTLAVAGVSGTHSTTIADSAGTGGFDAGYLNVPNTLLSTSTSFTLADAGKAFTHTSGADQTYTIPYSGTVAYPPGTVLTMMNVSASNISIAATTDVMYIAGTTTTGTRTLAQNGVATMVYAYPGIWLISGAGLT